MSEKDGSDAARPRPVRGRGAQSCRHRVVADVRVRVLEMKVIENGLRVETLLKQVPDARVFGVELLRVRTLKSLHHLRHLLERGLHEQVKMRRHQAIDETAQVELAGQAAEAREEQTTVDVV